MIPALGGVGYGQVRKLILTFKVKKIYRSHVVPVVSFKKIQEIHFVAFNYLNATIPTQQQFKSTVYLSQSDHSTLIFFLEHVLD